MLPSTVAMLSLASASGPTTCDVEVDEAISAVATPAGCEVRGRLEEYEAHGPRDALALDVAKEVGASTTLNPPEAAQSATLSLPKVPSGASRQVDVESIALADATASVFALELVAWVALVACVGATTASAEPIAALVTDGPPLLEMDGVDVEVATPLLAAVHASRAAFVGAANVDACAVSPSAELGRQVVADKAQLHDDVARPSDTAVASAAREAELPALVAAVCGPAVAAGVLIAR